jgi:glucose/arabinose dehydrogenase
MPRRLPGLRLGLAATTLALAIACGRDTNTPPGTPTSPGEAFTAADGTRFAVETVVTNLEIPWSLAFAPDGRLFVTERPGRVRIVENGRLAPDPALVLNDVHAVGEAGLLGLALHPDFAATRLVYLVYTARRADGVPVNRLVRYREAGGTLAQAVVLLDDIPAAAIHDGSRLRFGPDGLLYMTMGDAATPSVAQDPASLNGKILRLNDDGTTPASNPFSSPVYSIGHRNPQGIDWDPLTGNLWETEHGQSANDEVNLIERGRNYGWPVIEASQEAPGMERPIFFFAPETAAPSGASFYRSTRIPEFAGNLFFGALRGAHLHRVVLDAADRRRVAAHERLLDGRLGRIRDVVSGPDGAIYFCTNNRDGRGTPIAEDDRIMRIVPAR